ncbi:hypothetical protein JCM33374_g2864 [Metschnikowia sp. JCM 33374]|nr:hypothetical protein JCM33374_g2864 [Metschnikowia sp. JCM 33374]
MGRAPTQKPNMGLAPRSSYLLVVAFAALFSLIMFFSFLWQNVQAGKPLKLRLYTHNIRYDNKNLTPGERPWELRRPLVSESIENNTSGGPSVVCLQEVLFNQLEDILADLNTNNNWEYFGVGRKDGIKTGEYAPILYKTADWALESSRTYWLSETPDKPSVGWDAALERIVTEVVLKSKRNGQRVKVLNTHFDHKGVKARRESVKLIIRKMQVGHEPSFLCGDFNTQPTDEPYSILKGTEYMDSRTSRELG